MSGDFSLNAGNELEGEISLVEEVAHVDIMPEIKSDAEAIAALESCVTDLMYLGESIRREGGMNQSFAMEAIQLVPDFGKVPVGFYTKDTSATRYKAALEELDGRVWVMIGAAIAALVVLVAKFIGWLFGDGKKDGESKNKSVGQIKEQIEEKVEQLREAKAPTMAYAHTYHSELEKLFHEAIEIQKTEYLANSKTIDQLIDNYISKDGVDSELARVLKEEDPLFSDIMNQGQYFEMIKNADLTLRDVRGEVEGSVTSLRELVKNAERDATATDLTEIDKRIDFIKNRQKIGIMDSANNKHDVATIVAAINKVKLTVHEHHTPRRISFTHLNDLFVQVVERSEILKALNEVGSFEGLLNTMQAKLDESSKELEAIMSKSQKDIRVNGYVSVLKEAIGNTRKELTSVFSFLAQIKEYGTLVLRMLDKVIRVNEAVLRIVESKIKEAGGEISPDLKLIHERIVSIYSKTTL